MLQQRVRPRVSAGILPPPAPLYDLRGALQRRAEVFGPYDGDEVSVPSLGAWQTVGAAARRAVTSLAARVAS